MISDRIFLQFVNFNFSNAIDLGIMVFSLLLLGLSLFAFKNTKLKKILYAAAAFGLFAIRLFLEYVQESNNFLDSFNVDIDTLGSIITLGILILFFIAIVKRR